MRLSDCIYHGDVDLTRACEACAAFYGGGVRGALHARQQLQPCYAVQHQPIHCIAPLFAESPHCLTASELPIKKQCRPKPSFCQHTCYKIDQFCACCLPLFLQRSMDAVYEVLNKHVNSCSHGHKAALTRLVKPLWEQLDLNIAAAKNVERGLQEKQRQAAARRAAAQQQRA